MQPLFVASTVESIRYLRGETVTNIPVNITLCKSLEKSKVSWYPDNEGKPSIKFNGCDTQWVYNDEGTRNSDFEALKNNNYLKKKEVDDEICQEREDDIKTLEITVDSLQKVIYDLNVKIANLLNEIDC